MRVGWTAPLTTQIKSAFIRPFRLYWTPALHTQFTSMPLSLCAPSCRLRSVTVRAGSLSGFGAGRGGDVDIAPGRGTTAGQQGHGRLLLRDHSLAPRLTINARHNGHFLTILLLTLSCNLFVVFPPLNSHTELSGPSLRLAALSLDLASGGTASFAACRGGGEFPFPLRLFTTQEE